MSKPTPKEREYILAIARHNIPIACVAAGIIALVVSVARLVLPQSNEVAGGLTGIAVGCVFFGLAWLIRRGTVPPSWVPWIFATTVVACVEALLVLFWTEDHTVLLAYVILATIVYGVWLLSWPAFIVATPIMFASSIAFLLMSSEPDPGEWVLALAAGAAGGGLMMWARMSSALTTARAQIAVESMATTDQLTGVLNRHGLDTLLPMLAAGARRRHEEITVCFVDIDGLKLANDTHGHEFGDQVIITVAQAVRASVREGDLVARWGGDEFLVVGPAPGPDVHALEQRIDDRIAESGLDRGRWTGTVTVGFTSGDVDETGFDALVTAADTAMYEIRRDRRQWAADQAPQI